MLNYRHFVYILSIGVGVTVPAVFWLIYLALVRRKGNKGPVKGGGGDVVQKTEIRVSVPLTAFGRVIGCHGAFINKVQTECGVEVTFEGQAQPQNPTERVAVIRGTHNGMKMAEEMIRRTMESEPTLVSAATTVSMSDCDRSVGQHGLRVPEISRKSNCKVDSNQNSSSVGGDGQIVGITGAEHDTLAKTLMDEMNDKSQQIVEKISNLRQFEEMDDNSQQTEVMANNSWHNDEMASKSQQIGGNVKTSYCPNADNLLLSGSNGGIVEFSQKSNPLMVFLSAVQHPGHFWVQVLNEAHEVMIKLNREMTAFYASPGVGVDYAITQVVEGEMVAGFFDVDQCWYRAVVVQVLADVVDLYFIDFGDSLLLDQCFVRRLRPEDCSLPPQAVECALAGVERLAGEHDWSEDACAAFEKLSRCATWRALEAEVVEKVNTDKLPTLKLVDMETGLDVAEELVSMGLVRRSPTATCV